jgi:hypothetical protein
MAISAVRTKRIKVTFPQPVFDLLVTDVPPGKRSAFIGTATEEALRRKLLHLEPDSPLYQDMAEILQRREQGDVKLHSHTEVWGE